MGRMSDLWKSPPAPETSEQGYEVVSTMSSDDVPWDSFDVAGAPFIEVGGAQSETSLRLVEPPVIYEAETVIEEPPQQIHVEVLPPGLFTVRFRPVIAGILPGRGFGNELIAFHDPDHPISEQYRQLIAEMGAQYAGPPRVLLFTGSTTESGTTTVMLNIAMMLARMDQRVTVVDANWSRPSLASRLGLGDHPGLREVLAGRAPLKWAIQPTRMKGIQALVAGKGNGCLSEIAIPPVIAQLRAESDWVLLDAPTFDTAADSVPLADCCDGMYLVIRQPEGDNDATYALQQDFLESTGRLKGCILTQR